MSDLFNPSTPIGALVIGIIAGLVSGVILGFITGKAYERYSIVKKKNIANVKGNRNVVIQDSQEGDN